jgi:hypothetical protein
LVREPGQKARRSPGGERGEHVGETSRADERMMPSRLGRDAETGALRVVLGDAEPRGRDVTCDWEPGE